jgi:Subtilase family
MLIWVVDSDLQPIDDAEVHVSGVSPALLTHDEETKALALPPLAPGRQVEIVVGGPDFLDQRHTVTARNEPQFVTVGLQRPGELSYAQGDSRFSFVPDQERFLLVLRGPGARAVVPSSLGAAVVEVPLLSPKPDGPRPPDEALFLVTAQPQEIRELRAWLADERGVVSQFSRPIQHAAARPLGLTEEVIAAFAEGISRPTVESIAAAHDFVVVRPVEHVEDGYILHFRHGAEYTVLTAADTLAAESGVLWAEPNLQFCADIDCGGAGGGAALVNLEPYLRLVKADAAWDLLAISGGHRGGSPTVAIAVVDPSGVTTNHPAFNAVLTDGNPKMAVNVDAAPGAITAQSLANIAHAHGTQCAGSATGAETGFGTPGVAPNCRLIGARIQAWTNQNAIAELFLWLAGMPNPSAALPAPPAQPADVISSSWGQGTVVVGRSLGACFDTLTQHGRNQKGVLLCWSIGDDGHVDFTSAGIFKRSYAADHRCIGVGASIGPNPTNPVPTSVYADPTTMSTTSIAVQQDRRSLYNPFGSSVVVKPDLVCPSDTAIDVNHLSVDAVVSCTLVGAGGISGDYDRSFGGTSHAAPAVAGALALLISARPDLDWLRVKDVLQRGCVPIDLANGHPVGKWLDTNGDGVEDFSRWYGAGRLDVFAALQHALAEP